ncbi:Cystathionine beta-lyase PatB [Marinomonas gallaica]|uniref:cysteine-S-conjugate beta-lyase n=1 Tax=Marinomonas gallaica TaxID=1806667 RepID=A0A1C3JM70_9GAMM|nr:PatB family C-S lyase [Marinomonas gallaica]SBT16302.1 Cystathionine beta-lyase PatB [Marinomonas gallaica]SBT21350.1 Cystathionine beta-lyase PatB [Marinomonas gallaica]
MSQTPQFDEIIDRSNHNSDKWSKYPSDIIPMWIADMDFDAPRCVKDALTDRVQEGVFGYTHTPTSLVKAIQEHCLKHYNWQPATAHLIHLPGLVCALHLCVRALTEEGDRIIVPSPVYYHLTKAPEMSERSLDKIPFVLKGNRWSVDLGSLEESCKKADAKMLLLCNPHNPGATVYTQEELLAIHSIAQRHDLLVVSDEIHCDLILSDAKHIPFASLNEDAAQRSVILMAPSKTFNIAGLCYAFAVIANPTLRQCFKKAREALIPAPNLLALVAAEAAYKDGAAWHDALLSYLKGNRDYLRERIQGSQIKMADHDATYLAWLDVREYDLEDPHNFFLKAGVGISDGSGFGAPGFIRLNFGCSKSQLEQAMNRILIALESVS